MQTFFRPLLAVFCLSLTVLSSHGQDAAADEEKAAELREKAKTQVQTEQLDKAIETFEEIFKLDAAKAEDYLFSAFILMSSDRADDAVASLEKGAKRFPEDFRLPIEIAQIYNFTEKYAKAAKIFEEMEPKLEEAKSPILNDQFYFAWAAAAEQSKQYDKASLLLQKSIALVPSEAPERAAVAYNYLGYMWVEQGKNLDNARDMIKMAVGIDPESGAYVDSLGWYYFKIENYPKALKTLLEAADLMDAAEAPDSVVFDHVAQAYFQLGHRDHAIGFLEQAKQLAPDDEEIANRLKSYKTDELPKTVPLDFLKEKD